MDKNIFLDDICTSKFDEAMDFEFYRVLFDPVRSKIMIFLGINGPSNISTISSNFTQDRTVISRHLDLMYRYKIVTRVKKSREYIYDLSKLYVIEKFEKTASKLKELASSC